MNRKQRRGRLVFVVVATLLVLPKLAGMALAITQGLEESKWLTSVVVPLGTIGAIVLLYKGMTGCAGVSERIIGDGAGAVWDGSVVHAVVESMNAVAARANFIGRHLRKARNEQHG